MWVLVTTMIFVQTADPNVMTGTPTNFTKVYSTLSECEEVIDNGYRNNNTDKEFILDAQKKRVLKEKWLETIIYQRCVKAYNLE